MAGRLAPASEVAGGHTLPFLKGHGLPILKWYVLDPATSEAGARRPRSSASAALISTLLLLFLLLLFVVDRYSCSIKGR
jgi:hypothetical protein